MYAYLRDSFRDITYIPVKKKKIIYINTADRSQFINYRGRHICMRRLLSATISQRICTCASAHTNWDALKIRILLRFGGQISDYANQRARVENVREPSLYAEWAFKSRLRWMICRFPRILILASQHMLEIPTLSRSHPHPHLRGYPRDVQPIICDLPSSNHFEVFSEKENND